VSRQEANHWLIAATITVLVALVGVLALMVAM
jgi:hypothetical protein